MKEDFIARLVVNKASDLSAGELKSVCNWLRRIADDLEREPEKYGSKRFTAKHMSVKHVQDIRPTEEAKED